MDDCPTLKTLTDYNEGRITDPAEVDRITLHIGKCVKCLLILDEMPSGPLAKGLRNSSDDMTIGDSREDEQSSSNYLGLLSIIQSTSESTSYIDPRTLGENRYEVLASVGDGKFGRVVGAFSDTADHVDENLLAIKIPWAEKLTSERHKQQFFADCKAASSLDHPNVLPCIDHGLWDRDRVFYATKYLFSTSLTTYSRSAPNLSDERLVSIFQQTASALQYAHKQNVLHRHLNPSNIFLESVEGETLPHVRVTDFGFAMDGRYLFDLLEPKESKDPFASPESRNLDVKYIDIRADIYSLGKILKLLQRVSTPNGETANEFQVGLSTIIEKSTTGRRRDRYQTLEEFVADFQSVADKNSS